jgi:hypothetical protein
MMKTANYDIAMNPVLRERIELEMLNDAIYNAEEARRANVRRQMNVDHIFDSINAKARRPQLRREAVDADWQPVTRQERVQDEARHLTGAWTFLGVGLVLIAVMVKVVFLL